MLDTSRSVNPNTLKVDNSHERSARIIMALLYTTEMAITIANPANIEVKTSICLAKVSLNV